MRSRVLPYVAHAPDRSRTVIADEERSVFAHSYAHRPSPDFAFFCDEAGKEVLVLAASVAVLEWNADDRISRALVAVPRAMLGREDIAAIFFRELLAVVESHLQRCVVRLQQDIRRDDLALQFRM